MDRGAFLTLPNMLSMSRLVLAAGFLGAGSPATRLALIATASITDFLDGWLARRRSASTQWGALLDPIADRAFVFAAVCAYLFEGALTTAQYFMLLSRDIATAIGFVVARSVPWLRPIAFRARMLGKVVTALQLVTLIAVLITPERVETLVLVVAILSAASIVDYTLTLWRERAR